LKAEVGAWLAGVTSKAQELLDDNFLHAPPLADAGAAFGAYRTYHLLPDKTRARLPLKQIWIPVAKDGGADS
jgi:predicted Mrr-cat superfamily restriction endonuclease